MSICTPKTEVSESMVRMLYFEHEDLEEMLIFI